ncbi:hypothetical protein DERP_000793 [Dermatophagoides pteronyssinus]|uniref:Uncharacterized protein n=1 Tax=Dermatophagoides pteronyssinus TaxID=6956 RepID=A0ABQ8J1A2_DERPT|nr:hypothetical protein DERP_000793 [Dermatophagoides pteronyssinus]
MFVLLLNCTIHTIDHLIGQRSNKSIELESGTLIQKQKIYLSIYARIAFVAIHIEFIDKIQLLQGNQHSILFMFYITNNPYIICMSTFMA